MTDNQKNIVGAILLNMSANTVPITEDMISKLVDMNDNMNSMMYGTPKLTTEERDEVIAALHAALFVRIDRGHFVKEKDHTPWYMAAKAENGSKFWDRYRLYLLKEKHWNGDTINELDKTTDEIMDLLRNPEQLDGPPIRRGLCIGDVQSGKTSSYIGLINKAADAHYRVIILLTGTIEKLRRQTQQRIDEGFIGLDSYAFTLEKGRVQVGVGAIDPTTSGWAVTSTTSDFNAATAKKVVGQLSNISAPVIFVLKKNKSVLEKLEHWLRFYNINPVTKKIDLPMLLIDDEADNASVNTKADDVTAINKGIRKLLALFDRANYVGFTATPYANVFIDPDSEEEMLNHDLFPRDFIYALEAPDSYIGARSIFGEDAPYGYMLESNDDCEHALPIIHKKEDAMQFIPESLKEALAAFFIANAVRDLRGDKKTHRTMMINVSRFIAVQNQITKIIDSYVRDWQREIRNYYLTGEEALRYESFSYIKKVYEKHFKHFASDPNFAKLKHFSWEQIQEVLYPAISRIVVRTINGGNAPKNLDYENYEKAPDDIGLRLIAVGGLSLSRGLTLEGLCTSYFYRNSSMYDTLMQMGRWFGYRNNYQDLCKIWMPELSMAWYSYISAATDELRAEVKRMQNEDMTPTDFGLAVRSDIQGLLVTARNKMRSAKDYETVVNFSGEVVETKYVHSAVDVLRRNYAQSSTFLTELQKNYPVHQGASELAVKHPQILGVKKEAILDFLQGFAAHTMNTATGFDIQNMLDMFREDESGIFDTWDILIAGGTTTNNPAIDFSGLNIHPVVRGFAYRKDTKSLQMSGKNSRLGSKDLAKGGLTHDQVETMEAGHGEGGKSFSESFYFKSGHKRNPLLVIYPVKLAPPKDGEEAEQKASKQKIINDVDFPVIGLSIGVPAIKGMERIRLKYKVNKQKWLEIFGADNADDFDEIDDTIPED